MRSIFLSTGQKISLEELKKLGGFYYKDLIVGAVDMRRQLIVFGGEFNNDARNELLDKQGSKMGDVWGFKILLSDNLAGESTGIALTDIRPGEGNYASVTDEVKSAISDIIQSRIEINAAV